MSLVGIPNMKTDADDDSIENFDRQEASASNLEIGHHYIEEPPRVKGRSSEEAPSEEQSTQEIETTATASSPPLDSPSPKEPVAAYNQSENIPPTSPPGLPPAPPQYYPSSIPLSTPPFFNPFMTPFMPQPQVSAAPGVPPVQAAPFYLTPTQYQQMFQMYLQGVLAQQQGVYQQTHLATTEELMRMKLQQGSRSEEAAASERSTPSAGARSGSGFVMPGPGPSMVEVSRPNIDDGSSQPTHQHYSEQYPQLNASDPEAVADTDNTNIQHAPINQTAALFNKKMAEIEKEITRPIQNQHVKTETANPFKPGKDTRAMNDINDYTPSHQLPSTHFSPQPHQSMIYAAHFPQAGVSQQPIMGHVAPDMDLLRKTHLPTPMSLSNPPNGTTTDAQPSLQNGESAPGVGPLPLQENSAEDGNTAIGPPPAAPPPPQQQQQRKSSLPDSFAHNSEGKGGSEEPPVWVMRESYLNKLKEEERRRQERQRIKEEESLSQQQDNKRDSDTDTETDRLLGMKQKDEGQRVPENHEKTKKRTTKKKEVMVHEPAVLIEGVLFRASYLGSTQLVSDGIPTKATRMMQAQEAVTRIKAPNGESQPAVDVDLFISTEKIMVLNTDLQRISDTDVRQDIMMDHPLRTISYIADIGDVVVLMARRVTCGSSKSEDQNEEPVVKKTPKIICHVFESEEAQFIAQSIGQAFQVAYIEFLRANGIEDTGYLREIDYQDVLNQQHIIEDELEMFAKKEMQKDVVVPKQKGEALGMVIVESGWGSMLPTVVVANLQPGGAAARCNNINIGDQLIGVNGISLVGLPLSTCQTHIKNTRQCGSAVKMTLVRAPPVVEVRIKRPDTKYQLGFSVQNGVICSLLRGGIAERGGVRVGHRIIEINNQSVVAVPHERIVNMLATSVGLIQMKTMPTSMFRLLTGQETPQYI